MSKHTPGPWRVGPSCRSVRPKSGENGGFIVCELPELARDNYGNAHLIAAAPEMLAALHEGRRAIGDHYAPNDCYATGPLTGDPIRDLVQCPACSFVEMYDRVVAKATGDQP